MSGRQVDGGRAFGKPMARDDIASIFVVFAVRDDEFHLVMRSKPLEVAPIVAVRLPAAGTLDIEDGHDGFRHIRGAAMAAPLQQYRSAAVDERLHQRVHFVLEQRFTPCYLNKGAIDPFNFGEYLVNLIFG